MNKKYSGLSIASLVFGICSLFIGSIPVLGWIIILLALILGVISIYKIKRSEQLKGRGLGIAGLVLGLISLVYISSIYFLFFQAVSRDSEVGKIVSLQTQCERKIVNATSCSKTSGVVISTAKEDFRGEITASLTLEDGTKKYSSVKQKTILPAGGKITINPDSLIESTNQAKTAELSYVACNDISCVACQSHPSVICD